MVKSTRKRQRSHCSDDDDDDDEDRLLSQSYRDEMLDAEAEKVLAAMCAVDAIMAPFLESRDNRSLWPDCGKGRTLRLHRLLLSATDLPAVVSTLIVDLTRHQLACNHRDDECGICGLPCKNEDCSDRLWCVDEPSGNSWCGPDCSIQDLQNQGLLSDSDLSDQSDPAAGDSDAGSEDD